MEETRNEIVVAIIISSIVIVILAVFTMLFFLVFVRKKRILNKKKEELTVSYEKLLLQTKLEIQQETLNNISREIHDNIGQVLSFVKLTLGTADKLNEKDKQEKIDESVQLVAGAINDLRDLSKSLSFDKIKKEGLYRCIKDEAERLNKNGIIEVSTVLTGSPFKLGTQTDLILYRIFQEIVNNTLKHSKSKTLLIDLKYSDNLFILTVADKGIGFNTEELNSLEGQGLENIKQRALLINAAVAIESKTDLGCSITITLNRTQDNNSSNE